MNRRMQAPGPRTRRSLHLSLVSLLVPPMLSCSDSAGPGPRVAALEVTPDAVELRQAEERQLAVAAVDEDGLLVTGVTLRFASNDPANLEVTPLGLIKAKGRAGSFYVRVTAGRVFEDVPVDVEPVVAGIEAASQLALLQHQETQITPVLRDINGFAVTGTVFRYDVHHPSLISVSATGMVRSLGPRGTGSFTVSVPGSPFQQIVEVTVTGVPTTMSIAPNPARLAPGGVFQLQSAIRDAHGDLLPGVTATFSGGVTGIGSVSATGLVTAGATSGTFTVTATYQSLTAQGTVQVGLLSRPDGVLTHVVEGGAGAYGVDEYAGIAYVAGLGGGLAKVSLATHQTMAPTIPGSFIDARFGSSGDVVYAVNYGQGALAVVDVATHTITRSIPMPGGEAWALEVAPGTGHVYVGGVGRILVVDPGAGTIVGTLADAGNINHFSVHPTQPFIYASDFTGGRVHEIDIATRTIRRSIQVPGSAQGTAVSPDGVTLFVASETGTVFAVDLASGSVRQTGALGTGGFGIALTRDGTELYVSIGTNVAVVDVGTLTVRTNLTIPYEGRRAVTTGDGTMVLVSVGPGVAVIE